MKAAKLDWMGVFEYSDVDNADSYALDAKVDAETITDRRRRLMAVQKKVSRENLRAKYGHANSRAPKDRSFTALIEGPSKDNPMVWEARLEGMAPEIDGKLYLTDIELPGGEVAVAGDVARVEITKTDAYDLIGRVVEITKRFRSKKKPARMPALHFPWPEPRVLMLRRSFIASLPARRCASWGRLSFVIDSDGGGTARLDKESRPLPKRTEERFLASLEMTDKSR